MATIGNTTITSGNSRTIAQMWRGIRITTTEAGTLTSITVRVVASGTHRARAFLYNNDGTSCLASSTIRADLSSSLSYQEFTGFNYALADATTYHLAVAADAGNTCTIDFITAAAEYFDGYYPNSAAINLDSPGDMSTLVLDTTRDYAIYGTYTPAASSTPIAVFSNSYRLRTT